MTHPAKFHNHSSRTAAPLKCQKRTHTCEHSIMKTTNPRHQKSVKQVRKAKPTSTIPTCTHYKALGLMNWETKNTTGVYPRSTTQKNYTIMSVIDSLLHLGSCVNGQSGIHEPQALNLQVTNLVRNDMPSVLAAFPASFAWFQCLHVGVLFQHPLD